MHRPLIFFHMPKTGGTSLRNFFKRKKVRTIHRGHKQYCSKERLSKIYISDDPLNGYSIVFLRDPVKHTESLYTYIKATKAHRFHQLANTVSFEQFIVKFPLLPDYFCRYLSCYDTKMAADVDEALQNIQEIDFIGFTETLSKDISTILKNLGYDFSYDGTHRLKSKKRVVATPKEEELIRKIRKNDYMIYNLAKELYDKQ